MATPTFFASFPKCEWVDNDGADSPYTSQRGKKVLNF